ncbi:MAG TPA: NAD(P)/FAD-dependent oxidoreductase [Phycisphaerae bacterium]|nr:NAD(P)/FAD-dependent oxidoreductase [Phycisphaerae bacterium]HPS52351.1 NAD(P)/FAD-dependent oxidoreductase [Phycisphaerae bacterium]
MQPYGGVNYDIAIIGAGAAGQTAAIAASQTGRRVVLIEQMSQPGKKLLATGGGRCNITRMRDVAFFESVFGRQGRFMNAVLNELPPQKLRDFFKSIGVATKEENDGMVYPVTEKAMTVQAALRHRYEKLGVRLITGHLAEILIVENGRLAGVELAGGMRISAPKIILACGGRSWPTLGGTGGGYALAVQAGHTIKTPTPTLVPLLVKEHWVAKLAGVALPSARVWINLPRQNKTGRTGDVLFTHKGLTGPAVLDISGDVAELLASGKECVPLQLEPVAGMDASQWRKKFEMWRNECGRKHVVNLLKNFLPTAVCETILELAAIPTETTPAQLTSAARDKLAEMLGCLNFTINGTEEFDIAFVTRGGVTLKEVNPSTLESRIMPGLYFAGELLDLDGPCGGFNLQWAFSSGYFAGKTASM